MQALLLHFRQHGKKAIEKVAREQPASYLKILGLLVPREHKVEHSNPLKGLTDEQLEAMIEYIETSLAAQAGAPAKMIEGTIEPIFVEVQRGPLLDSPKPKNRLCWRPTRQPNERKQVPNPDPAILTRLDDLTTLRPATSQEIQPGASIISPSTWLAEIAQVRLGV